MATAAVVMAVVTLVSSLALVPAPALVPSGGNEALLRLADEVAKLPDDRGAYWRRPLLNNGLIRVKAGDKAFNVLSSSRIDLWQPRDVRDPVHVEQWEQFVRPATPADERVWRAGRRAGHRPAGVHAGHPRGRLQEDSDAVEALRLPLHARGRARGVLGDRRLGELTLADISALPGDAALLRERLRAYWKASKSARAWKSFEEFLPMARVLLELPVSPSVRAAALRLLAGLPTTKVRGSVTDPMGTPGPRGHPS
ncbi:hypothetical protein [Nonomuraea dietziae]|uniref:hypothetical protein n=1 Tax=Nonomuraea dietziae TaxID=65515 RepID=UPI0031CE1D26